MQLAITARERETLALLTTHLSSYIFWVCDCWCKGIFSDELVSTIKPKNSVSDNQVAILELFNGLLIQLSKEEITQIAHQPKDMIRKGFLSLCTMLIQVS